MTDAKHNWPHLSAAVEEVAKRTIKQPPQPVGYYDIGGTLNAVHRRPHRLARLLARLLLDWKWREARK